MSEDAATSPRTAVLFLARAESRVRILEALTDRETATQRELRDQIDASRTTVSRALRSLIDAGWVERTDGAYRLTRPGRAIATEFHRLLDTVDRVDELEEFLQWFPEDVEAPGVLDADDVDVTYTTEADPYAPARRQSEILHSADRLRVLLPAIDLESTRTIVEQVTDRGLEVETVASPGVEATMTSGEFAPLVRRMLETDRSRLFVAPEPLPFYLGLSDDGLTQIGLADDDGVPRALLETTDEGIRAWGERLYASHREPATPTDPTEF